MNALAEKIYKPVVLNPLGQTIRRFCLENPYVAFNAPPDFQMEFSRAIGKLKEPTARLKYLHRGFYENRPLIEYLKNISPGDMCLAFIPDKKVGGLTVLLKVKDIWKPNDVYPNWKIVIGQTRNFTRYFGDGGLWTSCIAAITRVVSLKREMCWRDPEFRVFMEKAVKYGAGLTAL